VLAGNRWLDTNETLVAAGSIHGQASAVLPVGDGSKVFITDNTVGPRNADVGSFFASCDDGKLSFTPAPALVLVNLGSALAYSDSKGGLWFCCRRENGRGMGTMHVTEK
jgi:hypothetical protein